MLRNLARLIGTEAKVVAVVLAGLLAGELGMRAVENRLSIDVGHLQSFDALASQLMATPDRPHVLFLGNSMTRYGITQAAFEQEFLNRAGVAPVTVKINPDNTALPDWYYAYKNYFYEQERRPDVVVIGFEGGHLRDQPTHHSGRLAQYYCDAGDWSDLCRFDLPNFEERASYWLSAASAMYSNRDRLQRRVLDEFIPGYRNGIQELNSRQSQQARREAPAPAYERLRAFLKMTQQQGTEVIFAAMPIAAPYELEPQLLALLAEQQVRLVDCRHVPGIVPAMFPDGIHMTADAAQLYSRYLAEHLAATDLVRATVAHPRQSRHGRPADRL
jgi:hypothetical protein